LTSGAGPNRNGYIRVTRGIHAVESHANGTRVGHEVLTDPHSNLLVSKRTNSSTLENVELVFYLH